MRYLILLLLSSATLLAADPLPNARKLGGLSTGWRNHVGVPGGIPARTTIFQTFSTPASTAQIQTSLDNCPSNQVVLLGPWTNNMSGSLNILHNGVTLRGTTNALGQQLTRLNFPGHGVLMGNCCNSGMPEQDTPVSANHKNITAGLTQGSTVLTIANTTGLSVGMYVFIDQLNDTNTTAYSPINPDGPYVSGEYMSVAQPGKGYDRIQFQYNRVEAISGNDVTLAEPIYDPNWDMSLTPQLWFVTAGKYNTTQMSGVEDLNIVCAGVLSANDIAGVFMLGDYASWVKNCAISIGTAQHTGYVWMWLCLRPEVRHCYGYDSGPADRYGMHTRMASGGLVTDNIISAHSEVVAAVGCSGFVWSYNYSHTNIDQIAGSHFGVAGIFTHAGTPHMNLFEGNITTQFQMDNQWQNANYNVCFRNRLYGRYPASQADGNIQSVALLATNRNMSVIGCCLGKGGIDTVYEISAPGSFHCGDPIRIYYLGFEGNGENGCNGAVYDPFVKTTLIRACNWTSATTTNGGIVWDGFTPSDIPSSYYLTGATDPIAPNFGFLPYPPIDPTMGNISGTNPTNTPAAWRMNVSFVNGLPGQDPPAGGGGGPPPTPPSPNFKAKGGKNGGRFGS